ncbi:hypothetical protein DW220_07145 [Eubacterium sp. AM18-26]|nr:hypothetical protein DW220_07145 [Eubacterium sp. AM18-26]RHO28520.1 hypothetical protein DW212_01790 [Eubacterium sp. AM18-10LB-B]
MPPFAKIVDISCRKIVRKGHEKNHQKKAKKCPVNNKKNVAQVQKVPILCGFLTNLISRKIFKKIFKKRQKIASFSCLWWTFGGHPLQKLWTFFKIEAFPTKKASRKSKIAKI